MLSNEHYLHFLHFKNALCNMWCPQERHLSTSTSKPSLLFTYESETGSNSLIPFLDILLSHCGGLIRSSVCRKPTHTDRYLDFNSHLPAIHKAVAELLFSLFSVCTLKRSLPICIELWRKTITLSISSEKCPSSDDPRIILWTIRTRTRSQLSSHI